MNVRYKTAKVVHRLCRLGMVLGLLGMGFIFCNVAYGQQSPMCNKRDIVLELLAKKYNEAPVAAGITNAGTLIEVLTTEKGETWSILVTKPNGISCLVSSGEGWMAVKSQYGLPS